MNLTSPSQVLALLQQLGLHPNSALGQNFLIDVNIRDIILDAAAPGRDDVVLEVGPGLGVLTEELVARAGRVVAVEKDRGLHDYLAGRFRGCPSLTLIHQDALELDAAFFERQGITQWVSNLPYSVGSRVLMNGFALPLPPRRMTVTVQLEVAERLAAGPGHRHRGLLGVWAQREYDVRTVKVISPTCFCPSPKVKSAVVRLDRLTGAARGVAGDRAAFRALTRLAFGYRRKQLGAILARLGVTPEGLDGVLASAGLDHRIRPERLTVDQWQRLADAGAAHGVAPAAAPDPWHEEAP